MKAVFDVKPDSGYDDEITRRYHFPSKSNYLAAARDAVGDWVLYREPQRNGGRRAYIATARVIGVEPDPESAAHFYAHVADYLEFPAPGPVRGQRTLCRGALARHRQPQPHRPGPAG